MLSLCYANRTIVKRDSIADVGPPLSQTVMGCDICGLMTQHVTATHAPVTLALGYICFGCSRECELLFTRYVRIVEDCDRRAGGAGGDQNCCFGCPLGPRSDECDILISVLAGHPLGIGSEFADQVKQIAMKDVMEA